MIDGHSSPDINEDEIHVLYTEERILRKSYGKMK
jgi:hypothetical protein